MRTVGPAPPAGATLEFAMTIDVRPARATAWTPGRNLVFMSLRRVGGSWLVYETGSAPDALAGRIRSPRRVA